VLCSLAGVIDCLAMGSLRDPSALPDLRCSNFD